MRVVVAIIFAWFYLGINSGLAVSAHYCCGFLVDWTVNTTSDHCEDKPCHDMHWPGCCEDTVVFIDAEDHLNVASGKTLFPVISTSSLTQEEESNTRPTEDAAPEAHQIGHSPPLRSAPGLYVLFQQLRFCQ